MHYVLETALATGRLRFLGQGTRLKYEAEQNLALQQKRGKAVALHTFDSVAHAEAFVAAHNEGKPLAADIPSACAEDASPVVDVGPVEAHESAAPVVPVTCAKPVKHTVKRHPSDIRDRYIYRGISFDRNETLRGYWGHYATVSRFKSVEGGSAVALRDSTRSGLIRQIDCLLAARAAQAESLAQVACDAPTNPVSVDAEALAASS